MTACSNCLVAAVALGMRGPASAEEYEILAQVGAPVGAGLLRLRAMLAVDWLLGYLGAWSCSLTPACCPFLTPIPPCRCHLPRLPVTW